MRICFPTQLLDLVIFLLIATVLLALFRKSIRNGKLVLLFLLLFSTGRFASEFTRGDDVGGNLGGLSPVQIILLGSFILSVVLLVYGELFDRVLNFNLRSKSTRRPVLLASVIADGSVVKLDRYMLLLLSCL